MIYHLRTRRGNIRLPAAALGLANRLEVIHGYKTSGVGQRRIARLVPVGIILAADDVEEVAFGEGQFLAGLGLIVVERADDLHQSRVSTFVLSCRMLLLHIGEAQHNEPSWAA